MKGWITLTKGTYAGTSINPAAKDVSYKKEGSKVFILLGGGRIWEVDPVDQKSVISNIRKN